MEYISAEEFLKQPVEVQKIFWNYFEGSFGIYKFNNGLAQIIEFGVLDNDENIIPLLTEGQICKFIEDKTGYMDICVLDIEEGNNTIHYEIECYKYENDGFGDSKLFNLWEIDLLQAYWKVATEIAKSR